MAEQWSWGEGGAQDVGDKSAGEKVGGADLKDGDADWWMRSFTPRRYGGGGWLEGRQEKR